MSKATSTFRKADVKRAIQAAESAGMKVARVDIDNAGKISVVPDNGVAAARGIEPSQSWDDALK